MGWYPCCCEPVAAECEFCDEDETPYQISVEVPAITDGSCTDCESLAGTYVVTQYETISSCWWRGVFSNPTTCTGGFGTNYDQLIINLWLTTVDNAVNVELSFGQSSGGASLVIGTWKYEPSGGEGRPSCLFDELVIPAISNGACSPYTGSDSLTITAV